MRELLSSNHDMRVELSALVLACSVPVLAVQASFASRIDAAVERVKGLVPGLSGSMSPTEQKPVTADTQFRLASLSKPFTAVAVLQLVQQGRVDLDRPAREYCPALSPLEAPTVRHFLLHQSGMRHTSDAEDENIHVAPPSLSASLAGVAKEPLKFSPGQKTLYTSWGYTVLGCVIESVSKQTYAAFVQEHVLRPAGMNDTAFDAPEYSDARFSQGFRMRGGRLQPSVVVDTRFKMPSSGIISTVNDLSRFAIALFDRVLLPETQLQEMLSTRRAPGDERQMFTAGWTIGRAEPGAARFNYNGSMEGTTAYLVIVPERRTSVALLTNRERFVPEVTPVMADTLQAALEHSR